MGSREAAKERKMDHILYVMGAGEENTFIMLDELVFGSLLASRNEICRLLDEMGFGDVADDYQEWYNREPAPQGGELVTDPGDADSYRGMT